MEKMFLLTMHGDDYHGDIVVGLFTTKEQALQHAAMLDTQQIPCIHCGDKRYPGICAVDIFPPTKAKG